MSGFFSLLSLRASIARKSFRRTLRISVLGVLLFSILGIQIGITSATPVSAKPSEVILLEEDSFFSTVSVDWADRYNTASDGDLWPSAWSDDGRLYAANGDGKGFDVDGTWSDIVVNRINGHPDSGGLTGVRLSSGDQVGQVWDTRLNPQGKPVYNRKPTGMVSVNGVLYLAVQDLNCEPGANAFNDAPNATIVKSADKGVTWTWDTSAPMFSNYKFTTIMFLDFGQDGVDNVPDSTTDDYIYAYGIDYNWRDSFTDTVPDPVALYLARINKTADLQGINNWQFYTGDLSGNASWSAGGDLAARTPVLRDERRVYSSPLDRNLAPQNHTVISQGSIVYNKPLDKYIYTSWTEWTYEFYEALNPWGPWRRLGTQDFGVYPWSDAKNGGYTTVVPSKFISSDGKTMWVQSNTFAGGAHNYNFSLRKISVEPYASTEPSNIKIADNLGSESNAPGVIAMSKSAHHGNLSYLNDASLSQTEDSWDGDTKSIDWWGYTWPRQYNVNRVVYTTGNMFTDGGWFTDLRVQVRQNFSWTDVSGLTITSAYPFDGTAGPNKTYAFTFDDTRGDGVRIIGTPGGRATFTSIGELEVYYSLKSHLDDFNSTSLHSAWTWSIPLSGPSYSLTGDVFRLSVPRTKVYDQWTTFDNAPKLYRTDMGDGDWFIETKLYLKEYTSGANFHTGLMVKLGDNDYYLWGNAYGNKLSLTRTGYPDLAVINDYKNRTVYLRFVKIDATCYADYKTSDSDPWIFAGSDSCSGTPQWVGLITKTWSKNKVVSDFDYFLLEEK